MTRKNKYPDYRKQLLIRYSIDKEGKVSFIDPCCDDMPANLFCNVMKAFADVEREWNDKIQPKKT